MSNPKSNQNGRYARHHRTIGTASATINRETLSPARRAFRLADQHEPPLVAHVPHIEPLKEKPFGDPFRTSQ